MFVVPLDASHPGMEYKYPLNATDTRKHSGGVGHSVTWFLLMCVCVMFAALYQGSAGVSGITQSNPPTPGMLNMGMNGMTQQSAQQPPGIVQHLNIIPYRSPFTL